jgi:chromosome partitioning protein
MTEGFYISLRWARQRERGVFFVGKVLCIVSQKGGVGKTTTAVNLAAAIAIAEKNTLLVDCDAQGNASTAMGISRSFRGPTLSRVLTGGVDIQSALVPSEIPYLNILPAKPEMYSTESAFRGVQEREYVLRNRLDPVKEKFDCILIDSPPSLGLLTANALVAADGVLIPLQCEYFALEGLSRLLALVHAFKRRFNHGLYIAGILLTMADPQDPVSRRIAREARRHLDGMVFRTVIPRHRNTGEPVNPTRPLLLQEASLGAKQYLELAREVLSRNALGQSPGLSACRAQMHVPERPEQTERNPQEAGK